MWRQAPTTVAVTIAGSAQTSARRQQDSSLAARSSTSHTPPWSPRVAGTLLPAALIVGFLLATDSPCLLVACVAATAFSLYALDERGYSWLVVLLTPTVLLMIIAIDFEGDTVALDRTANTVLGIVIGRTFGELANAPRGSAMPAAREAASLDTNEPRRSGTLHESP